MLRNAHKFLVRGFLSPELKAQEIKTLSLKYILDAYVLLGFDLALLHWKNQYVTVILKMLELSVVFFFFPC